ncbi:MAG: hypothetical protein KAR06_11915 [Deltaproteobacteria bacterium]|nr:hypothetical protein [Deltaproteobacteria bacterium]
MKIKGSMIAAVFVFLFIFSTDARADFSIGVSASDEGITGFHLAIGEFYSVPKSEVVMIRKRKIPDDELAVVFFLSKHSGISVSAIARLRLGGMSWMEITLKYGLSPDIYFVKFDRDPGPPYGKAYGYYKNKPKSKRKSITFSDADIVNFVNLKFVSQHYGITPDEVVKMRGSGESFVEINSKVKRSKGKGDGDNSSSGSKGKGNGKGKGKNK